MKALIALGIPALALATAPAVQAATVIINATTLNGSFEDGTGTGAGSTIIAWSAYGSGTLQRINNFATQGSYSAVLGLSGTAAPINLAINTGYSITAGDTYTLSFQSRGASGSDDGDTIAWKLFYTSDNTLGGTATNVATGNKVLTGTATGTYTSFDFTSSSLNDPGAVGKNLFLIFEPGANFEANEFSRIDNVILTANIPEPTSHLFLGAALSIVALRRKRCG